MRKPNAPVLILFASLFIVMLGFGIVIPIMPFYVTYFGASGEALGVVMASYSLMQFVFAPFWGRWSDRVGRKPVLLIGLIGFAISFVLQGLARDVVQLTLARGVAGMLSSATLPVAFAFIGDTTSEDDRSGGMGMMGAAIGLGMIFGPLLGGPLGDIALPLPFFAAAFFALAAAAFAWRLLPESLPLDKRIEHKPGGPSRARVLIDALRGPMAFLFVMSFLLAFALTNFEAVLGLFGLDRFELGPAQVGYLLGAYGFLGALMQGAMIGPLTRKIGEVRVLQLGLIASVIGFVGTALAMQMWSFVIFSALFNAGNALLRPSVASLISQRATSGQGVAMGLENSFMSLGRVVGPLWAGYAYDARQEYPFFTGAILLTLAFGVSLFLIGQKLPVRDREMAHEI
ncbi:MAG: MFS transporter [Chloroflexi bacterium]|nr:MFS transporter [Chloroflexota bacterium]